MENTIVLEHDFFKMGKCYNLEELLSSNTIPQFCKILNKQSLSSKKVHEKDYKGWGFEFLIEALIKLSPVDNRIGINNYKVIGSGRDWGTDGYGIGLNGKPATVQIKYKSNHTTTVDFNADHIGNFVGHSYTFNVDRQDTKNLIVFTTGSGLHHSMPENEICLNPDGLFRLTCINYNDLRSMLDNNINFWDEFRKLAGISKK